MAVAVPARDEFELIVDCLAALLSQARDAPGRLCVHLFANNCVDGTAERARAVFGSSVQVHEVVLPPARAHAGWARRLALERAAADLTLPQDVLLSTDADTLVAPDWLARTIAHLDAGHDAIAGWAEVDRARAPHEWISRARRWSLLRRYSLLTAYLRATPADPWPRHDYEGGASLALTLAAYRRIAPLPTPPVGEDRAIFDALRATGAKVRHALDVRVRTSARLHGRAPGGMADTVRHWVEHDEDTPVEGLWPLHVTLAGGRPAGQGMRFADLPTEIARARALVMQSRRRQRRVA